MFICIVAACCLASGGQRHPWPARRDPVVMPMYLALAPATAQNVMAGVRESHVKEAKKWHCKDNCFLAARHEQLSFRFDVRCSFLKLMRPSDFGFVCSSTTHFQATFSAYECLQKQAFSHLNFDGVCLGCRSFAASVQSPAFAQQNVKCLTSRKGEGMLVALQLHCRNV